ncbi:MAG: ROK family protein [Chloroflexi bacterium]|nr:ROK family protein [Chloroflexota bacterium]
MAVLGIDIGGSGIKGAPVDLQTGALLGERFRVETPHPAKLDDVIDAVGEVITHFNWRGPVGIGFPGVIKQGVVWTAANLHKSWIGINAEMLIARRTGCGITLINDADAAGLAEMHFGAGRGRRELVLMVTIGTGIGTALFMNGQLVPNLELGHLTVRGKEAERRASDRARSEKELSWKAWSKRLNEVLLYMEQLLWPDLIIIGGGVSKNYAKFCEHLTLRTPVERAQLLNNAGIIGAALTQTDEAASADDSDDFDDD